MSITRKILTTTLTGLGIGFSSYELYKKRQQKNTTNKPIIVLGQYSCLYQMVELSDIGKLPLFTNMYIEKHFTRKFNPQRVETSFWGQPEIGCPMSMSRIIKKSHKNNPKYNKYDYLNIAKVAQAQGEAIDYLRQKGAIINEVEKVNDLKIGKDNKLYVNVTINTEDARQIANLPPGSLDNLEPHRKNGKFVTLDFVHDNPSNTTILNTLQKPRVHSNKDINGFLTINDMFAMSPGYFKAPISIFGFGPSAMWGKETNAEVPVIFIAPTGSVGKMKDLQKNPRNSKTVESINPSDIIETSRDAPDIVSAELALNTSDEIVNKTLKNNISTFLKKYNLPKKQVAVVFNTTRDKILGIGLGINAIGFEPNHDVVKNLPESYRENNVISLHLPSDELQRTIAPSNILGSVHHNMDWQRQNPKFQKLFNLSNDDKTVLMPIERLFFREKEHGNIITQYMKEHANINVNPEFYKGLTQEIAKLREGISKKDMQVMVVKVFSRYHSEDETRKFESTLKSLITKKRGSLGIAFKSQTQHENDESNKKTQKPRK